MIAVICRRIAMSEKLKKEIEVNYRMAHLYIGSNVCCFMGSQICFCKQKRGC